jgi:hypothetical protein
MMIAPSIPSTILRMERHRCDTRAMDGEQALRSSGQVGRNRARGSAGRTRSATLPNPTLAPYWHAPLIVLHVFGKQS